MAKKIDMGIPNQWQAGPEEELKIPEGYVKDLKFEIVVFAKRKEFSFRCKDYKAMGDNVWVFDGVIIDSSIRKETGNPVELGKLVLKRLSYHPILSLVNVSFMVVPAPEGIEAPEISGEGGD